MHIGNKLAKGVSSWLRFEFQCSRGHLFEEKYLSYPIGQILHSEYGNKLVSEQNHPLLEEHTIGPGKRPKLDFAVLQDNNYLLSIEAKWAGKTPLKVEDIIWDLVRLELMANKYKCDSFFLLAGQKKKIQSLFQNHAFQAPLSNRSFRPILKDGVHRSLGMKLDAPPKQREKVMKKLFSKYPDIEIPTKISSGNPYFFPKDCNNSDFQVYVWEIKPVKDRTSFIPRNHKLYA